MHNAIHRLGPNDIYRLAMCRMGCGHHASGVLANDTLDVLPTDGVVCSDLESTIEDLQAINARLGGCYNELHCSGFFVCS